MIHKSRNGFAVTGCRKKNGSTSTAIHHLIYYKTKSRSQWQKRMKIDIAKNLLTTKSITLTIGRGAVSRRCYILYRRRLARPEYLLLHYTAGHWDFPKGNIEAGENKNRLLPVKFGKKHGITDIEFFDGFCMKIKYKYRHGRKLVRKEVMLYLARTHTRQVILSHEHIGFAWRKFDEAMQQLTYRNATNLLSARKRISSTAFTCLSIRFCFGFLLQPWQAPPLQL